MGLKRRNAHLYKSSVLRLFARRHHYYSFFSCYASGSINLFFLTGGREKERKKNVTSLALGDLIRS